MIDTPSASYPLIAVDWGTTNRRAYLIDASRAIIDRREDTLGILSVPPKGFGNALGGLISGWRRAVVMMQRCVFPAPTTNGYGLKVVA